MDPSKENPPPYQPPPPGQPVGGYPPNSGGYPPPTGGYPPTSGGYPPTSGGFAPQPGAYPPNAAGYPPNAGGYPPPQAYPPVSGPYVQPGYTQQSHTSNVVVVGGQAQPSTVIVHERPPVNHALHCIISFFFWPWIIVWIILCIAEG